MGVEVDAGRGIGRDQTGGRKRGLCAAWVTCSPPPPRATPTVFKVAVSCFPRPNYVRAEGEKGLVPIRCWAARGGPTVTAGSTAPHSPTAKGPPAPLMPQPIGRPPRYNNNNNYAALWLSVFEKPDCKFPRVRCWYEDTSLCFAVKMWI